MAVDEAVESDRVGKTPSLKRSLYEQSFRQCINLWEDAPDVRPLTFHPRIGEVAAALLTPMPCVFGTTKRFTKNPKGRETDPHLDHDYWAIEEARTVTAWIPFDGSSENAGSMGYVPGSHKFDVTAVANIFTGRGFDLDNGDEARVLRPSTLTYPGVR
ncbi:MAG: hypothetical protein CM1200mP9_09220 [Gammaproteobacteria bacterium]|nr:MAG: hypothetical protein CM1200mP9_09220 [Gammaproteobacteria bacterium]